MTSLLRQSFIRVSTAARYLSTTVTRNADECGVVESVKAVSEIYSPVSGTIIEVNDALEKNASIINKSPLEDGWLFKLALSDASELKRLMTAEKYKDFLKSDTS